MPNSFQITRIKKPGGSDNPHTHIEEVYVSLPRPAFLGLGTSGGGLAQVLGAIPHGEWRPITAVIADIEAGTQYYYTDKQGKRAEVMVASRQRNPLPGLLPGRHRALGLLMVYQHKYIKTRSDETTADNLLSLPNDYGS